MTDARSATYELGGRWHGRYGVSACPVCQPERRLDQNALSIADGAGALLLHCKKLGCDFRDILAAGGLSRGSWTPPDPAEAARREAERRHEAAKRSLLARGVWDEAQPISGTPAEIYLRGRAIACPLPDTLRFHPDCWHKSAKRLPALVGLVEGAATFAVHRTYLDPGSLEKSMLDPAKAMLGAVSGGAVRLSESSGPLVVAEGIETALSLAGGLLPSAGPVWASLSAGGMKSLSLPVTPGELIVCSDGDAVGRAAAKALAERAVALGWRVSLADPGDGLDFNDLVLGEVAA